MMMRNTLPPLRSNELLCAPNFSPTSLKMTVFQMSIAQANGRLRVGLLPVPRPQPDLHGGFFAITAVNRNNTVRPNATRTNEVKLGAMITCGCFPNATCLPTVSDQIHYDVGIVLEIDARVIKASLFVTPR